LAHAVFDVVVDDKIEPSSMTIFVFFPSIHRLSVSPSQFLVPEFYLFFDKAMREK